ncbi:MAG: fused MFS/spermidine synthase [Bacteroidota bacterium]
MKANYSNVAFIIGGVSVSTELLCYQLLQPFAGNSFFIWLITLSFTLIGMLLGYYSTYNKNTTVESLPKYICIALFFYFASTYITKQIIYKFYTLDYRLLSAIIALFFVIPVSFYLTKITPILVSVSKKNEEQKNVGNLFLLSTIGAATFILVTGVVLIPYFGFLTSKFLLSVCLLICVFVCYKISKSKSKLYIYLGMLIVFFQLLEVIVSKKQMVANSTIEYASSSILGQMQVINNGKAKMLVVNSMLQSTDNINEDFSTFPYVHFISYVSSLYPEKSNILLGGVGSGSLIKEFIKLKLNVTAVDIDKRMFDVAEENFNLNRELYDFYVDDFRHFLNKTKNKYDVVVLDISIGESQPAHLYTVESFSKIKDCLTENGIVLIHYVADTKSKSFCSLYNTILESGMQSKVYSTNEYSNSDLVLVVTKNNLNKYLNANQFRKNDRHVEALKIANFYNKPKSDFNCANAIIFTDNNPVLDILHQEFVIETRTNTLKNVPTLKVNNLIGYE